MLENREFLERLRSVLKGFENIAEELINIEMKVNIKVRMPSTTELSQYLHREVTPKPNEIFKEFEVMLIRNLEDLKNHAQILADFEEKLENTPSLFPWHIEEGVPIEITLKGGETTKINARLNSVPPVFELKVSDIKVVNILKKAFPSVEFVFC